jgi:hypothetical protein
VLAVAACSDSPPPPTTASTFDPFATLASSGGPAPAPVAALAIGNCFDADNFTPGALIDLHGVRLVDCAQPHQHEVYAVVRDPDPPESPFPGDSAMASFANDQCLAVFEAAIGVAYADSNLDFAPVAIDETAWRDGDRNIICAAHDTNFEEVTGSRVTTTTAPPTSSSSLASESG